MKNPAAKLRGILSQGSLLYHVRSLTLAASCGECARYPIHEKQSFLSCIMHRISYIFSVLQLLRFNVHHDINDRGEFLFDLFFDAVCYAVGFFC
jgi:hypothetical protein